MNKPFTMIRISKDISNALDDLKKIDPMEFKSKQHAIEKLVYEAIEAYEKGYRKPKKLNKLIPGISHLLWKKKKYSNSKNNNNLLNKKPGGAS